MRKNALKLLLITAALLLGFRSAGYVPIQSQSVAGGRRQAEDRRGRQR